jgi:hypothetical protein
MKRSSFCLVCVLFVVVALLTFSRRPHSNHPAAPAPAGSGASALSPAATPSVPAIQGDVRQPNVLRHFAYAQAWRETPLPALAAFRDWTDRYRAATPRDRLGLEAEGVALAQARRPILHRLIKLDPEGALAVTVPAVVRQTLPASVLAELEARISGRGELAVVASVPAGEPSASPSVRRITVLNGQTYTASVYGRREPQGYKDGISLHGIAIDRDAALHESPVRVLEPGEIPRASAEPTCPVSSEAVAPLPTGAGVNEDVPNVVEAEGRIYEFCSGGDMLNGFVERMIAAEDGPGARGPTPPTAGQAATAWTTGTKKVLTIRVDFSDFPGEPMARQAALDVLNGPVRSYFENVSYGLTSITGTVSEKVYRLPQSGTAYAVGDNEGQLHTDARTAASADYTLADFDRIIVLFTDLDRIPGSKITFGGQAIVPGANVWINGASSFSMGTVSHELGHTYGLKHANLWRINDGNPVSNAGVSVEYGDPFDIMGSSSVSGVAASPRHHFNQFSKNRLGWLPDAAVTTATKSGTYRIYRFDSKDASRSQPLALRIFRDGVRWYWVGLRQNFATGTPLVNDAYVLWGFNNRQQSQLLDLTSPGNNASDAALPIGSTFSDPAYGVSIKPLARGGTEPAQWLDVEVTMPASPPNVVNAWGREGVYFLINDKGDLASPPPDTYVPLGLTNVTAIAAGDLHVLALKSDGTVVAWGDNTNGQTNVPAGLRDVVAIAAGGNVSGAVKRDGTVQLWGESLGGVTAPPANLANVRQLAIGGGHTVGIYHALALRNDGTVVGWGDNTRTQATTPAAATNVVAIAASDRLSVALKADGTVVRWGTTFIGALPFPTGLSGIAAIATSGDAEHILALKTDGTVTAWGVNTNGQATPPADLNNVVAIATGGSHSLALKADGTVVAWGSNASLQTDVPPSLPRAYLLAGGLRASFALSGPSLYITEPPKAQDIAVGANGTLSVTAVGAATPTYQWRKDGVAIAGATGSTLALNGVTASAGGSYDVVVRDGGRTFTSLPARVNITGVVEVSRIANLSIRTNAGTGAQTLIVGFVVGGPGTRGTKPLLLRGVGPTLGSFGVAGALTDPKVELFNSASVKVQENDNWFATDSSTFASVGAFALTANSRDAALFNREMASGSYSAQLSGVGNAAGIVLAEIYDVPTGSMFTNETPRLTNVSARTVSGTGSNVLIAGFVIAGPTPKKVLIRAIGPTLGTFGVTGVLADPKLELFNGSSVKVQENDDWGGTAALSAAFTSVGAFTLAPTSRDAALLVTLTPGSYTAQVSGLNGGTGVALVEVYDIPE